MSVISLADVVNIISRARYVNILIEKMSETFICIASGPSLQRADCLLAARTGHKIIAVNSSWQMAPECHHIFASDYAWWQRYHDEINIAAQRWTVSVRAKNRYGLKLFKPPAEGAFNSGQRAIQFAAHRGAQRIILLGYDCTLKNGAHWHGEHPGKMHNPTHEEVNRWHSDFSALAVELPDVEIINCTRHTALTCFPTNTLENLFYA